MTHPENDLQIVETIGTLETASRNLESAQTDVIVISACAWSEPEPEPERQAGFQKLPRTPKRIGAPGMRFSKGFPLTSFGLCISRRFLGAWKK
mmetsp:Transcript_34677/g.136699  ORF Transcript_34677/g.136699 Transcript_34677/m.136699 type:complete len:93 (-) Transcript_34677:1847-2125(-)